MANIEKKLVIKASLKKDEQFKQEIESIKKEIGAMGGIENADLSSLKAAFKDISKQFADEMRKVMAELKSVNIASPVQKQSPVDNSSFKPLIKKIDEDINPTKANIKSPADIKDNKKIIDPLKAALGSAAQPEKKKIQKDESAKLMDQEQKSFEQNQDEQWDKMFKSWREKEDVKRREEKKSLKIIEKEELGNLDKQNKLIGQVSDIKTHKAYATLDEFKTEKMRQTFKEQGIPTLEEGSGGGIGGKLASFGKSLVGGGAAYAATQAPEMFMENSRELRTLEARSKYGASQKALSGDLLGATIERKTRENFAWSKLTGAVAQGAADGLKAGVVGAGIGAGVGSAFAGVGAVPGAAIGATLTGGYAAFQGVQKGWKQGEEAELRTRLTESELGTQAYQAAKQVAPGRMEALRGGAVTGEELNTLYGKGAEEAFAPEQTQNQFIQARGYLGREAKTLLPGMQTLQNQTGIDVAEQARMAETAAGFGGMSQAAGQQTNIDTLKKALSAGFDLSKTGGKLLQATTGFLENKAGLGNLDVNAISDSITKLAKGFAGGNEVTSANVQQAKTLAEMQQQQGMSTTGISGFGNILNIQEGIKKFGLQGMSGSTLMNMAKMGPNAEMKDYMEALNGDKSLANVSDEKKRAAAEFYNANKSKNIITGAEKAAPNDISTQNMLIQKETGLPFQEVLGMRRAMTGAAGTTLRTQAEAQNAENVDNFVMQNREEGNNLSNYVMRRPEETATLEGGAKGLKEDVTFKQAQIENKIQTEAVVGGLEIMTSKLGDASQELKNFKEKLGEVITQLGKIGGNSTIPDASYANAFMGSLFNTNQSQSPITPTTLNRTIR